jgi:hypothetical protein
VFPSITVRAFWRVHIQPIARPIATVRWGKVDVPLVEGCDVAISADPDMWQQVNFCGDSLTTALGEAIAVRASARPRFAFTRGVVDAAGLKCGVVDRLAFYPLDLPCEPNGEPVNGEPVDGAWLFDALPAGATSALAFWGCSVQAQAEREAQICGTWFATVEIRP